MEKLIYFTITRPALTFAIGVVSQFRQAPHSDNWNVVVQIHQKDSKIKTTT